MPQVSKRKLSNDIKLTTYSIFINTIADLSSPPKVASFLNSFLTSTEREMLSKRFVIAFMIAKDYQYRQISDLLKVSTTTVAGVVARYKNDEDFKKIVDKVVSREKLDNIIMSFAETITGALAYPDNKAGVWKEVNMSLKGKAKL